MEENERPSLRRRIPPIWVAGAIVFIAFVVSLMFRDPTAVATVHDAGVASTPTTSAEQVPPPPVAAQAPDPPGSPDSEAQSSPDATGSVPNPTPSPSTPLNCHDNAFFVKEFNNTAQTRKKFAEDHAETLASENIYVYARGDDNEYLLFVTTPENETRMVELSSMVQSTLSARVNICLAGFAEVQFLVRDESMHQTLIAKFQTNSLETFRFMLQRGGATPDR